MRRTIFIGDVHGCFDELQCLVSRLFIKKGDRLLLTGDLINKGPKDKEVLEYLYQCGFLSVMGNHDLKYRKNFLKKGTKYYDLYQSLSKEVHQWFIELPLYIEDEHFILVHGGVIPKISLENMTEEVITNIRIWKGKPWHEYYKGEKKVIYGHWAQQGYLAKKNSICLDTGCVYGKRLCAYILEEDRCVFEEALESYESIE